MRARHFDRDRTDYTAPAIPLGKIWVYGCAFCPDVATTRLRNHDGQELYGCDDHVEELHITYVKRFKFVCHPDHIACTTRGSPFLLDAQPGQVL